MNVINTTILKAPSVSLETLSVTPSTLSQSITPSVGYAYDEVNVDAVTSAIDLNIQSSNILSGVSILGVNGNVISANTTSLTASPSTVAQTFSPSAPYNGFDTVTLNAMQLQSRTVSPSTASQTITPSTGYDGLNAVTVNAMQLQTLSVQPSIASQTITPSYGYDGIQEVTFDAVTSSIDASIQPENIVEGVTILGVEGTATFPPAPVLSTLQVSPSTSAQSFTPSGFDGWDSVEVYSVTPSIDANIAASNIKSGVSILGVNGNVVELNATSISVSPSTSAQTITPSSPYNGFSTVTLGAVTSSIDSNIQPYNIISGASILGVGGTAIELNATTSTISPSTTSQTIYPESPYNGFEYVSLNAVTSSIDENIQAENIKSGVSILGVEGTYEGEEPILGPGYGEAQVFEEVFLASDDGLDGYTQFTIPPVTHMIDDNIVSENIKSGVEILGITGNLVELNAVATTVNPSTAYQYATPVAPYNGFSRITINPVTSSIDPNITPSNIVSGVSILGVTGNAIGLNATTLTVPGEITIDPVTYTPSSPYNAFSQVVVNSPAGLALTAYPSTTESYYYSPLPSYYYAMIYTPSVTASIDSNITASNIKSGTSILGVTGTLQEPVLTNIVLSPSTSSSTYTPTSPFNGFDSITLNAMSLETVNISPSTASQTISAASEYDALGTVNIASVTASIDNNIQAENIKSGVSILGVTGTYEGSGGGGVSYASGTVQIYSTTASRRIVIPNTIGMFDRYMVRGVGGRTWVYSAGTSTFSRQAGRYFHDVLKSASMMDAFLWTNSFQTNQYQWHKNGQGVSTKAGVSLCGFAYVISTTASDTAIMSMPATAAAASITAETIDLSGPAYFNTSYYGQDFDYEIWGWND